MDVFAEEGLKFFWIDKKVKDSSSTEIVVLEAKNLHMDYTFLVVTYVVYSNAIHNTKYILQTGINEYNVKVISMYDKAWRNVGWRWNKRRKRRTGNRYSTKGNRDGIR